MNQADNLFEVPESKPDPLALARRRYEEAVEAERLMEERGGAEHGAEYDTANKELSRARAELFRLEQAAIRLHTEPDTDGPDGSPLAF